MSGHGREREIKIVTMEEARQKLRELTALVESLRREVMLHPDDAELSRRLTATTHFRRSIATYEGNDPV